MTDPKLEVQASALKREYLEKLRDEFAGKAMNGLLVEAGENYSPRGVAIMAYEMAEAMLEARGES